MIVVKRGNVVVITAKNIGHAIKIFEQKFKHDLQWALENEDFTLEKVGN